MMNFGLNKTILVYFQYVYLLQGVIVKKSTLVLTIQKQHSSVSNSMIILLQMETGRRETVRLTRRRKAKLL